jgi:hypothetical protein
MIIYANSRKSGKTTKAIKLAASTHSTLIVPNSNMVPMVEKMSKEIGYPVRVMSADDLLRYRDRHPSDREKLSIVIDEIDIVLNKLFGCNVLMATTTGLESNIEIKSENTKRCAGCGKELTVVEEYFNGNNCEKCEGRVGYDK